MALKDITIQQAKPRAKPRKLADSHGLYIEIRPSGSKLWRYRFRLDGKEQIYAFGEYAKPVSGESEQDRQDRIAAGQLTLAEARAEHEKARRMVKQGIHPLTRKNAMKAAQIAESSNTFRTNALEWIEKNKAKWAPAYLENVQRYINGACDFVPKRTGRRLGDTPIREVTAADLLELLESLEDRSAVAYMTRQWCGAVFRYAMGRLRVESDPTTALRDTIKPPERNHHNQLPDIGTFLKDVRSKSRRPVQIGLELLLLTFVRPGELRQAKWAEFDLDGAQWVVPAERMKMKERHIVPLSVEAVALLRELHTLTGPREHLFPNLLNPKTCIGETTFLRALESMGYKGVFSPHGFRATASTKLNELGYRPDVIERQLAHKERNKVRASYNQAEYLEERKAIMQSWADWVYSQSPKVVPIRKSA